MDLITEKRKPGRPSLSSIEKQEIRNNIIEIARDLFVNEGYESTSMRKIAAQAGFAPTKIYYYFKNKKEILRYFWQDISDELWLNCKPPTETLNDSPLEVIRYLMNHNVKYWLANPKSYQLGLATQDFRAEKSENFDVYAAEGTRQYIELMYSSVQSCIESGIFRLTDRQMVAQIISVSIYGIYSAFYGMPTVTWANRDELIHNSIENTLMGLMSKD